MAADDVPVPAPDLLGSPDVKALPQAESLSPDGLTDGGPHQASQNQGQNDRRRAQKGGCQDKNHDGRNGEQDVCQTH